MKKTSSSRRWWWQKRKWQEWLHNLLLTLSRRRYTLIISDRASLGATSFINKTVEVNPVEIVFPKERLERKQVRHAPSTRAKWQQAITIAIIQHEAGHIRYSGSKPYKPTLGWLWNALEDERIERLLAAGYPQMKTSFEFLNDAVWHQVASSQNLLAGCLFWRWEWDRAPESRKFHPATPEDLKKWSEEIRPLVEKAWSAETSEQVTELAHEILYRLGISEDAELGNDLPMCSWVGPQGERGDAQDRQPTSTDSLPLPPVKGIPGYSPPAKGQNALTPYQASPEALLAQVEGYARDLAAVLKPSVPSIRIRPHSSRGELNLNRALDGDYQRPFDFKQAPAPARSVAILVLVDQSCSMNGSAIEEAIAATMLLDRAAEIAGVTFGVWGFEYRPTPAIHRPLAVGHNWQGQRCIASMTAWGDGTVLAPVFRQAAQTLLQRPEQLKLLVLFHDGCLHDTDAATVRDEVQTLRRKKGVYVQPIFIGNEPSAVEHNIQIFGHVLACAHVGQLIPLLRSWLHALF